MNYFLLCVIKLAVPECFFLPLIPSTAPALEEKRFGVCEICLALRSIVQSCTNTIEYIWYLKKQLVGSRELSHWMCNEWGGH